MTTQPCTFHLQRDHDVSGVSGTGIVAWGVLWPDGRVTTRWAAGGHSSTTAWDTLADVTAVHGHSGATRIVWHTEPRRTRRHRGWHHAHTVSHVQAVTTNDPELASIPAVGTVMAELALSNV